MAMRTVTNTGLVVEFGRSKAGAVPARPAGMQEKANGSADWVPLMGALTPVGYVPPRGRKMTFQQFEAEFRGVALRHRASLMAIGDLLNHSEMILGESYVQAAEATGYSPEFLRKCRWVAKAIAMAERQPGLSFSHYQAVAAIKNPEARKALLFIAGEEKIASTDLQSIVADLKSGAEAEAAVESEETGESERISADTASEVLDQLPAAEIIARAQELLAAQREERKASRKQEQDARRRAAPDLPKGRYQVLYADPPWRFEEPAMGTTSRSPEDKYPTMTKAELCALPVEEIAADDAVLYLWARPGMLDVALDVMRAWGFTYRAERIWVKNKVGMGYYHRNAHEILLVGKRGEFPTPDELVRELSVLSAKRRGHSVKPSEQYATLEKYYPGAAKIELFQRSGSDTPQGWMTWGDMAEER